MSVVSSADRDSVIMSRRITTCGTMSTIQTILIQLTRVITQRFRNMYMNWSVISKLYFKNYFVTGTVQYRFLIDLRHKAIVTMTTILQLPLNRCPSRIDTSLNLMPLSKKIDAFMYIDEWFE